MDKTALVLCASDRLEKARELEEIHAGFMTHNICAIIEDNNILHVTVEYLTTRLRDTAIEHNLRHPDLKVPLPYLFGEARGSFIFRTSNPLEAFPLADVSNLTRVNSAIFTDDYIISISRKYDKRYEWERIISEVNKLLILIDDRSVLLNIGNMVIGTKEEFWFSLFSEVCLNGHRTAMALVKHITSRLDQIEQLYYEGIRVMEKIKSDYANNF